MFQRLTHFCAESLVILRERLAAANDHFLVVVWAFVIATRVAVIEVRPAFTATIAVAAVQLIVAIAAVSASRSIQLWSVQP